MQISNAVHESDSNIIIMISYSISLLPILVMIQTNYNQNDIIYYSHYITSLY